MKKDHVRQAAKHHTDLTIFHAVVGILECGAIYTESGQKAAEKIRRICMKEASRQLKMYDTAVGKARSP